MSKLLYLIILYSNKSRPRSIIIIVVLSYLFNTSRFYPSIVECWFFVLLVTAVLILLAVFGYFAFLSLSTVALYWQVRSLTSAASRPSQTL